MVTVTIDEIRAAAETIAGALSVTPLVHSHRLSRRHGVELYLKLEMLHHTGSFKERGALVKLSSLLESGTQSGVIAMSAGNHAQGVAFHASRLRIPATIVMPANTPFTKVERTEAYGANVVLKGETLADAERFAHEVAESQGLTFVHPYDDPAIIAGQGTIGLEMLSANPELDTLIVPIGGGGLIAGVATAARALNPKIEIVGVETASYPSMKQTLAGEPVDCGGSTIAEGIAVKTPGRLTQEIVRRLVDDIIVLDELALERAVEEMVTIGKVVAEGAGAAGLGALIEHRERFAGRKVGLVVCGANIDARLLSSVLLRGLVRSRQLVRLRIEIPDLPGNLAGVTSLIGEAGANIVEVYHHRLYQSVPIKQAELDVMVETRDARHVDTLITKLATAGFKSHVLTNIS